MEKYDPECFRELRTQKTALKKDIRTIIEIKVVRKTISSLLNRGFSVVGTKSIVAVF